MTREMSLKYMELEVSPQGIARLTPNGDDESVVYIPREIGGWGKAHVEVGEGCEWSRYDSPVRWDEK